MTVRSTIYQALKNNNALDVLTGGRILQQYSAVPTRPFLVIRFQTMQTERPIPAGRGFLHIWAHDNPGSYVKIDQMLGLAKATLEALPNEGQLFEIHWLETSPDLPMDVETNSVAKFDRYQYAALT